MNTIRDSRTWYSFVNEQATDHGVTELGNWRLAGTMFSLSSCRPSALREGAINAVVTVRAIFWGTGGIWALKK